MPRLPKKNTTLPKRGWTAKPVESAGKKSILPKKRPTLQERLHQKADLAKRPGRDKRFVTAKDIQVILRCSERQGYRWLKILRKLNGKPEHAPVTLQEFCIYVGLTKEETIGFLKD